MAVFYKFKSAKDYDSLAIDGNFISVGRLKARIFESKHLGRGTDFDLVVYNAQTNEEYLDEGMLIAKNSSVLIRRVPGPARNPIVTTSIPEQEKPKVENDDLQAAKTSIKLTELSSVEYTNNLEWDEFGNDVYDIPENFSVQSSHAIQNAPPHTAIEDEDSKIRALIDTPALDWQCQPANGFGSGRGFGRMSGRIMGARSLGPCGLENRTPKQGYICHRCNVPGHFIQHCPTNGDPNYDIKRVKPPTGIPKSMLIPTADGPYALPSGGVAVLKPNEAFFEKQIEGIPSLQSAVHIPPELHCPLCKEVMKVAVLTSKCCFTSFCDKCVRDHIISKSSCVCGATNILADDLLPNKTLRDTIDRILGSSNSSAENSSAFPVQDMVSCNPRAKVTSPTQSAASKGQHVPTPPVQKEQFSKISDPPVQKEQFSKISDPVEEDKAVNAAPKQEKAKAQNLPDVSEAMHVSKSVKEAELLGNAQLAYEEVQEKPVSGDAGKKKKNKLQLSSDAEMAWRVSRDHAPDNYAVPLAPSAHNPYWTGMQPGLNGFMPPYASHMPCMGYGFSPMDMAFHGVLPQDPWVGLGHMLPHGPIQSWRPPSMSREDFEAQRADINIKREMERHKEMDIAKDRKCGRVARSMNDVQKKFIPPSPSPDRHHHSDRHSRDLEPPRQSTKRKSDHEHSRRRDHYHSATSCGVHHRRESSPVATTKKRRISSSVKVAS